MTHKQTRPRTRLAVVLALVVLFATVPTGVVAAEEDDEDGFFDTIIGASDDADGDDGLDVGAMLDTASAYFAGATDNLKYRFSSGNPERTADECAADIQATYNANNASFETYLNERTSANTSRDVIRIQCTQEVRDGITTNTDRESVYLVGDVVENNSTGATTYEHTRIVDSVDRPVDHRVVLSGLATEEGADDFEAFAEDYAVPNETPEKSYAQRMKGKYGGHIHGTLGFLPEPEDRT